MEVVTWKYFDKFDNILEKYVPTYDQGETKANQVAISVNNLINRWYNDGDVYDNTYVLSGWVNDVSSYANWLYDNVPETRNILDRISDAYSCDYELILKDLADMCLTEEFLQPLLNEKTIDDVYDYEGKFHYINIYEENEEY